jgi:MtN3 and saliva related transmembrane protein
MKKINKAYENYMVLMGSASSLVFYVQAYKIFMLKSAHDVSLVAFLFGLISVISWLIYGWMIKDKALIVSNTLAVIGATLAVSSIIYYS